MSVREAARRARISEGTWRRVESAADVERKPSVVAAMAAVLGVTGAQLADAGRPDAAGALQQLMERAAVAPDVAAITGSDGDAFPALMAEILAGLAAIDGERGLTPTMRRGLRAEFLGSLRSAGAEWQRRLHALRDITSGTSEN
jgi:hypothetical protein